jgi:imidazolonepropionase-like amidohydrolase
MRMIGIVLLIGATSLGAQTSDVAAARKVFEGNLSAIREKNREKYLSYYLQSERLVRGGPTGFVTGWEDFSKARGPFPDLFEANDLRLTPLQPGLVYGTYRYRVRYVSGDEHTGISERLFVKTPKGWKIAITGAVDTPPNTPAPPRALTGATLIDGRGSAPVENANVILRDGKIDCAGTAAQCPLPNRIDVTDVRGMWIAPGLIDAHVHFSQTAWADGRPDALDVRKSRPYEQTIAELKANPQRYGRSYLCSGVTSVFDVGGYPWTLKLHEQFENDTQVPHVVAAGPLLSTLDHWLNMPAERQFIHLDSEEAGRNGVRYLAAHGAKAVKVWLIVNGDLPMEKTEPFVAAAGDEARKNKVPLIVHATGLAEAKAALRAGANVLVHSVDDAAVDQEFIDLAKKNGTILIPTLTVRDGYMRMYRGVIARTAPAVDDPNGCVDKATLARVAETATAEMPAGLSPDRFAAREQRVAKTNAVMRQNLKRLVDAGVAVATGTDAGNPHTLHGPSIYAEMEAMQAAGMTPAQVIVASTATAARAMGLEKRVGTIEKGKDADLVVVAADPAKDVAAFRKLRYVVRSGVTRSVEDLHALAQR